MKTLQEFKKVVAHVAISGREEEMMREMARQENCASQA
jgi:hypothetical protein